MPILNSGFDDSRLTPFGVREENRITGFGEAVGASFDRTFREETSISSSRAWKPYIDERVRLYEETTGKDGQFLRRWYPIAERTKNKINELIESNQYLVDGDNIVPQSKEAEVYLRVNKHEVRAALAINDLVWTVPEFLSDDQIIQRISKDFAKKRAHEESVMARSNSKFLAPFLGATAAVLTDPLVLGTLPLGATAAAGRTALVTAGKLFTKEAMIAGAIEVPIQAEVFRFKNRIGAEFSHGDAAFNILAASLGAGALRGVGHLGYRSVKNLLGLADEIKLNRELTEIELEAEGELKKILHILENAPTDDLDAHVKAWQKAALDIEAHRPVDVSDFVDTPEGRVVQATDAVVELLAVAGTRLSRGDRINIGRELKDLEFKIRERREATKVTAAPPAKRLSASEKKKQAAKRKEQQAKVEAEIGDLQAQVEILNKRLAVHEEARQANKTLVRIEELKKSNDVEGIEKELEKAGFKLEEPKPLPKEPEAIIADILDVLKADETPLPQLRRILSDEDGIRQVAQRVGLDEDQANALIGAIQGKATRIDAPKKSQARAADFKDDAPLEDMEADIAVARQLTEGADMPVRVEIQGGKEVAVTESAAKVFGDLEKQQEALEEVAKCNT